MQILINITAQSLIYIFFTTIIYGYGSILKKIIFKKQNIFIGEIGILGFLAIYLLVISIHFVFPITILISSILLFLGLVTGIREIKKENLLLKVDKIVLIIFLYSIFLSLTINLHDDAYWYQLPTINYFQEFKIIFGIVNINHYIYGQALYEIMSVFQLPFIKNNLVYVLPVIFLTFFLIYVYEIHNDYKKNENLNFLLTLIILLLLFRYTRSKEFGSDLAAQIIFFIIFVNTILYSISKKKIYYFKSIVFITFGIFIKLYVILALPLMLIYLMVLKEKVLIIFKNKQILTLLIFIILISITKNVVQSGCGIYPIKSTCLSKNYLSWSPGLKYIDKNLYGLKAYARGYNSYTKNTEDEKKLTPKEYSEKYKYTYNEFLLKDKDFERLLIVIFIFLVLFLINFIFGKSIKKKLNKNIKTIFLYSTFFTILCWFLISPTSRYGGNIIILLFLFSIIYYFGLIKTFNKKKIYSSLIIFGLIFSVVKNFNRFNNEYKGLSKLEKRFFPIPNFKIINHKIDNKFSVPVKVTSHPIYCYNINMLCTSKDIFESITLIDVKKGYLLIKSDENKKILSSEREYEFIAKEYFSNK